jgi:phosphoglycerol transferase MdoB-like AlkP superfamily enzyme
MLIFNIIYAITNKAVWTLNFITILSMVLGIIEYYVYTLRATPLMFSYIVALPAAISVLGNYNFSLSPNIFLIILLGIFTIILTLQKTYDNHHTNLMLKGRFRISIFTGSLCLIIILFATDLIPIKTVTWDLQLLYHQNGFLVSSLKSSFSKKIIKPERYSSEEASQLLEKIFDEAASVESPQSLNNYPDIILIVNESYYDLNQLVPFTTDTPVTPYSDSLSNTVRGFAVNPNITTANSEFEILCSSSMNLVRNIVPFNSLNLKGTNSFIQTLKELGYHTTGMHMSSGSSYNRINAYPALGFDNTCFIDDMTIEPDFTRYFVSDESCYNQLIETYENTPADSPKFLYCLTIQNHADYETGLIDYSVNITSGLENTKRLREYLTLIRKSDNALKTLIDYFSNSERPTIVCMVGDHPPVMFNDFVTDLDTQLKYMATPFLLWANFPIEEADLGYFGMTNLTNIIKQYGDLPMTPYEQYTEKISKDLPVISVYFYMDKDNNLYTYSNESESPWQNLIDSYNIVQYKILNGDCKNILTYKY